MAPRTCITFVARRQFWKLNQTAPRLHGFVIATVCLWLPSCSPILHKRTALLQSVESNDDGSKTVVRFDKNLDENFPNFPRSTILLTVDTKKLARDKIAHIHIDTAGPFQEEFGIIPTKRFVCTRGTVPFFIDQNSGHAISYIISTAFRTGTLYVSIKGGDKSPEYYEFYVAQGAYNNLGTFIYSTYENTSTLSHIEARDIQLVEDNTYTPTVIIGGPPPTETEGCPGLGLL